MVFFAKHKKHKISQAITINEAITFVTKFDDLNFNDDDDDSDITADVTIAM